MVVVRMEACDWLLRLSMPCSTQSPTNTNNYQGPDTQCISRICRSTPGCEGPPWRWWLPSVTRPPQCHLLPWLMRPWVKDSTPGRSSPTVQRRQGPCPEHLQEHHHHLQHQATPHLLTNQPVPVLTTVSYYYLKATALSVMTCVSDGVKPVILYELSLICSPGSSSSSHAWLAPVLCLVISDKLVRIYLHKTLIDIKYH